MGAYYQLYRQDSSWIIDQGRGSQPLSFDSVNINGAIGVAQSGSNITAFSNAVLSISGTTATLTQGT